jgi:hypothetical protein
MSKGKGVYLTADVMYVGKDRSMTPHKLLFYYDQPASFGVSIAGLDLALNESISFMKRRTEYGKFLRKVAKGARNNGYAFVGEVIGGGKPDDAGKPTGTTFLWVQENAKMPPEVSVNPSGSVTDIPKKRDGVFGGQCSIDLSEERVGRALLSDLRYDYSLHERRGFLSSLLSSAFCIDV